MSDHEGILLSRVAPSRYAAAQQILGMDRMALPPDDDARPVPAKVYPAIADGEEWIVEAPARGDPAGGARRTFAGSAALLRALEYAHRTYGGALYLSR